MPVWMANSDVYSYYFIPESTVYLKLSAYAWFESQLITSCDGCGYCV